MDGKKNPPRINQDDLDQISAMTGGRAATTGQNPHNPQKPSAPKRPTKPDPVGGIRPIVPLVDEADVPKYEKWTREGGEKQQVFGHNQHGKIDQELNELALKEIASERGVTVEELLAQNPDKRLAEKVEFADMNEKTMSIEEARKMAAESVTEAVQHTVGEEMSEEEIELQLKEIELKKQLAAKKKAAEVKPPPKKAPAIKPKPAKKKAAPSKVHPLLKKLRQEFSIDTIKPVEVTVNGIKFSMTPPPGSVQTWSMEKLEAAGQFGSQQAVIATVRNVVVSTALVMIQDTSVAEIFGLTTEKVEDPLKISGELRVLMAQTIWEMIHGEPTVAELFRLDPEVVLMLYQAYDKKHGQSRYRVDGAAIHRFVCPIPDCEEMYEEPVPADGNMFCKKHAVPMEDHGDIQELDQLPLS